MFSVCWLIHNLNDEASLIHSLPELSMQHQKSREGLMMGLRQILDSQNNMHMYHMYIKLSRCTYIPWCPMWCSAVRWTVRWESYFRPCRVKDWGRSVPWLPWRGSRQRAWRQGPECGDTWAETKTNHWDLQARPGGSEWKNQFKTNSTIILCTFLV